MERFMDDDELYRSCLDSVMTDEDFMNLSEALPLQNAVAVFDSAHTKKGVLGKRDLMPWQSVVVKIVAPLCHRQQSNFGSDHNQLLAAKKQLKESVGA